MTKLIDWYSPINIKSYNKFLNFIIGGRGIGKTYGFKKDCISRYKKKGKQFLYLRRYKTDLKKIKTFLNDQFENFKDDEFKITGDSSGKRRWMASGELNSKGINYLPYGVFK